MEPFYIPNQLFQQNKSAMDDIQVIDYHVNISTVNNKVILTKFLLCFLDEGKKEVHTAKGTTIVTQHQAFILPPGQCLMTEKISGQNAYKSFLIFFDTKILNNFLFRFADLLASQALPKTNTEIPFVFNQDEVIKLFVESLRTYSGQGRTFPKEMLNLKVDEILLYLCNIHPNMFSSLLVGSSNSKNEFAFKNIIENNFDHHLTIVQMAFLCNMSISTFKRHFKNSYQKSPNEWIKQKRLQRAALLLKTHNDRRPSEIYLEVGYDSLSGFIAAFRQKFGSTPKQYQKLFH